MVRLLLSLVAVLAAMTTAASVDAVRGLIDRCLGESGAREVECSEKMRANLFGRTQVCAAIDMDGPSFRSVWDDFMRTGGERIEISEKTPWQRDPTLGKKVTAKRWTVEDSPLTVLFDERKGVFAVRYSDYSWNRWPCDELHARTGIYRFGDEGLVFPELTHRVDPEYPEAARIVRMSGKVVIHAIVAEDGTVSAACVAAPHYQDLGFEAAALEAVKQRVYEPGSLDGEPVPVWLETWVEFNLH